VCSARSGAGLEGGGTECGAPCRGSTVAAGSPRQHPQSPARSCRSRRHRGKRSPWQQLQVAEHELVPSLTVRPLRRGPATCTTGLANQRGEHRPLHRGRSRPRSLGGPADHDREHPLDGAKASRRTTGESSTRTRARHRRRPERPSHVRRCWRNRRPAPGLGVGERRRRRRQHGPPVGESGRWLAPRRVRYGPGSPWRPAARAGPAARSTLAGLGCTR